MVVEGAVVVVVVVVEHNSSMGWILRSAPTLVKHAFFTRRIYREQMCTGNVRDPEIGPDAKSYEKTFIAEKLCRIFQTCLVLGPAKPKNLAHLVSPLLGCREEGANVPNSSLVIIVFNLEEACHARKMGRRTMYE